MLIINLALSFLISIIPPTSFICDGSHLKATVYKRLTEQNEVTYDIENLDKDSFIYLEWRDYELEIPIVKEGSLSFANRFWRWSYGDKDGLAPKKALLSRQYPTGRIINYHCKA